MDEKKLLNAIASGKAILFTGAGFSCGAKNLNGAEPMRAKYLSRKISSLAGFDEDDDLGYSSDRFISEHEKLIPSLIGMLKTEYTIKEVTASHKAICNAPWKRFYTTNYDKVVETACIQESKMIDTVDTECSAREYFNRKNICIHINGVIDDLTTKSLNNKFKLSASSYVSAEGFVKSDWYRLFKEDVERCTALVFVGYSLYDLDIEKILFENSEYKNKTFFFIGKDNKDGKLQFKLSKYGTVIKQDVEYFGGLITDNNSLFTTEPEYVLSAFSRYELSDDYDYFIDDGLIREFLLYGKLDDYAIQDSVFKFEQSKYAVFRESVLKIFELIEHGQRACIALSDFGNGKTIFCRQLAVFLSTRGYDVFFLNGFYEGSKEDLDFIIGSKRNTVLIVDGYPRVMEFIEYYNTISTDNVKIILTSRNIEHIRFLPKLKEIGFNFAQLELDYLSDGELDGLVRILDNLGIWGWDAGLSLSSKKIKISEQHNKQISLILIHLLNSPQMLEKVKSIVKNLDKYMDTVFSICFLKIVGVEATKNLISEVSGNNDIYSDIIINNESFLSIFTAREGIVEAKSSLFGSWLLKNYFSSKYVMQKMHDIAHRFNETRDSSYERESVFKSVLRFSFIERVLPDDNKRNNLKYYYDKLKKDLDWLQYDPHFWLQYAMALMTFPDKYKEAQEFLDQAYALARKKVNYHTDNIDAQQARLHIKIAMTRTDGTICFDLFKQAHALLVPLNNDIYKFRQVMEYHSFYIKCYQLLNRTNKLEFLRLCESMVLSVKPIANESPYGLPNQLLAKLDKIINSIKTANIV